MTAGCDARVGCEPGQVGNEAALSSTGLVPSFSRPSFAATRFLTAETQSPQRRAGEKRNCHRWIQMNTDEKQNEAELILLTVSICGYIPSLSAGSASLRCIPDFRLDL
jgi:hypothetical protein